MKRQRLAISLFSALLALLTVVIGEPTLEIQVQNFRISFYPKESVSSKDCFTSKCPLDDNVNFYLSEIIDANREDPCLFAKSLTNLPLSEFEDDIFAINNQSSLDVNLATFFRTFYGSSNCEIDLTSSMEDVSDEVNFSSIHPVIVNIVEMPNGLITDHVCEESPLCPNRKSVRINFILPSWCQSTCGIRESDGCNGTDYGVSKKELDWIIARYEIRRLLHEWSSYLEKSNTEIQLLSKYKGNPEIDWAKLVDVHTKLNQGLYGSFADELSNAPGATSLDHALSSIISQHQAKRSVGSKKTSEKEAELIHKKYPIKNILSHEREFIQDDSELIL